MSLGLVQRAQGSAHAYELSSDGYDLATGIREKVGGV
ncbi:hypothetical protein BN949_02838 [Agrobacterium tumefaciens]|nr:hypothetical protein BN949_02838 [Agrobacterium tumefaciens]